MTTISNSNNCKFNKTMGFQETLLHSSVKAWSRIITGKQMSLQQGGRRKISFKHRTRVSRGGNEKEQRDSEWTWVPSAGSSRENVVIFSSSKALHFPGIIRVSDSDSFSWNAGMTKGNPRGTIYWQGKKQVLCRLGVHSKRMTNTDAGTQTFGDASSWLESMDQVHRARGQSPYHQSACSQS